MKFIKFSLFCFAVFFVNSCANYTFDSNISVDNVKNMFKSQRVKKYTNSELYNYVYVDLGTVEGLSCQLTEDDLEASEYAAKQDAIQLVAKKGGNGIVYSSCITLENSPSCVTSVSCYARAVIVKKD